MHTITEKLSLKNVTRIGGVLVVLLGVVFIFSRFAGLFGPTSISLSINDGMRVQQARLDISGKGAHIDETLVNGVPMVVSPNGAWNTQIILSQGINYITTENKTRFGKSTKVSYRIILDEPLVTPLAQNTHISENY